MMRVHCQEYQGCYQEMEKAHHRYLNILCGVDQVDDGKTHLKVDYLSGILNGCEDEDH